MNALHETISQAVEDYCTAKMGEFRNEKHRKQWRSTLDRAVPAFGSMEVKEIEMQDVLRVLRPIWTDKMGGVPPQHTVS